MNKLKKEDINDLKEVTQGFIQCQITSNQIMAHNNKVDQETITELFDIKFSLTYLERAFLYSRTKALVIENSPIESPLNSMSSGS